LLKIHKKNVTFQNPGASPPSDTRGHSV